MNHDVIPTFEEHDARIEVVLTDNVLRREEGQFGRQDIAFCKLALAA
jgi:hypothetical protein